MTLHYLGVQVELAGSEREEAEALNDFLRQFKLASMETRPGWCLGRWPDGKVYRHWRADLRVDEPCHA